MDEFSTLSTILEILLGTSILIVVIAVHGVGIRTINRRFNTFWAQVDSATSYWWINSILAIAIASLTVLHLMETLIWAIPISVGGLIPNMRNSYFYVLESYTTLGEGNVSLPERWRLIGPMIAMSGLFTFGWTGSVLVGIMTEFGRLDRTRAQEHKD